MRRGRRSSVARYADGCDDAVPRTPDRRAPPGHQDAGGAGLLGGWPSDRLRAPCHGRRRRVVRTQRPVRARARTRYAARAAHERRVGRHDAGMVARRFAAGVPVRPGHARASAAVHDGRRRRRPRAGGDTDGLSRERRLVERWRTPAGVGGRSRILRARLGCTRRARRRSRARSDRSPARRCPAAAVPYRPLLGRGRRGRSARPQRVGGGLGRRRHRRRDRVERSHRLGLVPRGGRATGPSAAHDEDPVRAPVADGWSCTLTGPRPSRRGRGLRK